MFTRSVLTSVLVFGLIALTQCTPREETTPLNHGKNNMPASGQASLLKVGMLIDKNETIYDRSYIQGAWEGLLQAQSEFGTACSYANISDKSIIDENFSSLIKENDLIVALSYDVSDIIRKAALQNTDKIFSHSSF